MNVFAIRDPSAIEDSNLNQGSLRLWGIGEVAPTPDRLLATPDELFEESFRVLQRFVEREGHADVPADHVENGQTIGNWVANMRYSHANGDLPEEQAARLGALPGWRWLGGDDYFLVEQFARREGHTDVPPSHTEEGRPVGEFVRIQRLRYRRGRISDEERERLEQIPSWHW